MSLQKLITTVKLCTACIIIHSKLFGANGLAEITGEVADPCKTRKNACPASTLFQCSFIRSDAADAAAADHKATPPPLMKNAADHQFVGAQL